MPTETCNLCFDDVDAQPKWLRPTDADGNVKRGPLLCSICGCDRAGIRIKRYDRSRKNPRGPIVSGDFNDRPPADPDPVPFDDGGDDD